MNSLGKFTKGGQDVKIKIFMFEKIAFLYTEKVKEGKKDTKDKPRPPKRIIMESSDWIPLDDKYDAKINATGDGFRVVVDALKGGVAPLRRTFNFHHDGYQSFKAVSDSIKAQIEFAKDPSAHGVAGRPPIYSGSIDELFD